MIISIVVFQNATSGGQYFVGFIVLLTAIGFIVAAIADFFMLTKVERIDINSGWHSFLQGSVMVVLSTLQLSVFRYC